MTAIDGMIRAAGETAVLLARIEERQRWPVDVPQELMGSVDAFEAVAAQLGTALAVSVKLGGMARLLERLEQAPAARLGVTGWLSPTRT